MLCWTFHKLDIQKKKQNRANHWQEAWSLTWERYEWPCVTSQRAECCSTCFFFFLSTGWFIVGTFIFFQLIFLHYLGALRRKSSTLCDLQSDGGGEGWAGGWGGAAGQKKPPQKVKRRENEDGAGWIFNRVRGDGAVGNIKVSWFITPAQGQQGVPLTSAAAAAASLFFNATKKRN